MTITRHAIERGRERLRLSAHAISNLADRAYERGQQPSAFAGSFRRYLDGQSIKGGAHVRVYGEQVYVFNADTRALITVFQVPNQFRRLLRRQRQR